MAKSGIPLEGCGDYPTNGFEVGHAVRLRGAGLVMTIERIIKGNEFPIQCVWHNPEGKLERDSFTAGSLVHH